MSDTGVLNQCVAILDVDPGSINAVIFDAFGTLVHLGKQHSPFRQLMKWARNQAGIPKSTHMTVLMNCPLDIAQAAQLLGVSPPDWMLAQWQSELQAEIDSMAMYSDSLPVLQYLRKEDHRIGVCSNLAMPYGVALRGLLPELDVYALSFEVGTVKPDQSMYRYILNRLDCEPSAVLFVGDSKKADFSGPRSIGMDACLINRRDGCIEMYGTDRTTPFTQLIGDACEMTRSERTALQWLSTPIAIFGDNSPLEHATTTSGLSDVEDLIGRTRHGIYS
jgi:HAD superfamily hydrolase (TIGR01549 family)